MRPLNRILLPLTGHYAHFMHRNDMRRQRAIGSFSRRQWAVPATTLPVDSLGVTPPTFDMNANDRLGICGPAMAQHVVVIYNWRQGKGSLPRNNLSALESQYERYSGGDNGTTEDMLVGTGGMWTAAGGGLEGNPANVVDDHLDIDVKDTTLARYAIDQFYTIQMAWSVPDDFIQGFAAGSRWLNAVTPNPANGHYAPLANVDASENYTLITWGATCTVSPAFVASVEPQCFVAFSRQQFDPRTGLDSKGRHVSVQAAKWVAMGGNWAKVTAVVAMFPGVSPTPRPVPPTPVPTPTPIPLSPGPFPFGSDNPDLPTALTNGLYNLILHRNPDQAGGAEAIRQLKSGATVETIAFDLIGSAENRQPQITALYRSILNREPDSAAMDAALSFLAGGMSIDQVATLLYDSAEFRARAQVTVIASPAPPTTDSAAMLAAINQARAANTPPLPPMVESPVLETRLAQPHADAMARSNIESHTAAGDGDFLSRLTRSGYQWPDAREIIATGSTIADAMWQWMSEPEPAAHKADILSTCTEAGCGKATAADGMVYWSVAFGRPA